MSSKLKAEVVRCWEIARELQYEWRELQQQADTQSPFTTFEWFDAWYQVYCPPKDVRVIVVRDNERVRAILPGVSEQRRHGGLNLSCFVFPADAYTPRCGVISLPDDFEATRLALLTTTAIDKQTDMTILPDVEVNSLTWQVISSGMLPFYSNRVENSYESPIYTMEKGWESYLNGRSRGFKKLLRQSIKRCEEKGRLTSRVFSVGRDFNQGLERLRELEARTWQGNICNGVLRNEKAEKFYSLLSSVPSSLLRLEIELLQINDLDVAFMLLACCGNEVFLMRTGFDNSYDYCRPGLVIRERLGKRLAEEGKTHFDLGAGVYEIKKRWETERRVYECFWLVNRGSLKGRLLLLELWMFHYVKPLLRWRRPETPATTHSG
jgi:CelD/BcsL family acetyltransferase involved in cellulose biosynthesis